MVMFFNPEDVAKRRGPDADARARKAPDGTQAANSGTPPVDVIASQAGLLARGSVRRSVFPGRTPV